MTQDQTQEALDDIIDYLDNRADVDDGIPNTAMKLMVTAKELRDALKPVAELEKINAALLAALEALFDVQPYLFKRDNEKCKCVTCLAMRKARVAIALAKQPDIDPVSGLPFNKD